MFAYDQIIQVKDNVVPYYDCPADITDDTNLYNCCATTNLPDIIIATVARGSRASAISMTYDPWATTPSGVSGEQRLV